MQWAEEEDTRKAALLHSSKVSLKINGKITTNQLRDAEVSMLAS